MMYIFGKHAIRSALKLHRERVRKIYVGLNKDPTPVLGDLVEITPIEEVPGWRLDQLAKGGHHQGVVVEIDSFPLRSEQELRSDASELDRGLFLIADGVLDPRNLGAMIRTLAAVGGTGLVIPQDRSAPISGATIHASVGCAFLVAIYRVKNLVRSVEYLKESGFWLFGLDAKAERSLIGYGFPDKTGIALGGEEKGIRRLVRKSCDELLKIPQAATVQSLNASVAAALALYEYARAQKLTG